MIRSHRYCPGQRAAAAAYGPYLQALAQSDSTAAPDVIPTQVQRLQCHILGFREEKFNILLK